MLNSSDCFYKLFFEKPNDSVVLQSRKVGFLCVHSVKRSVKHRVFLGNLVPAAADGGGNCIKLKNEGQRSIVEGRIKSSSKWNSYGGCIPSILQALEAIEDVEEALRPWEGSLSNKERTIILKEQVDWVRAFEIFEWFKKKGCHELNVIHYNIMLRIVGKVKKWDLLIELWDEMQSNRVMPTNSTYGTLIDACYRGGLKKEALVWLGELYKHGMEPDEITMSIILQNFKKTREFLKAEELFFKWSSEVYNDPESRKCYSLYTYNSLIDTYGKAGKLDKASDAFRQMLREGIAPDTVTFNTMIHVCGNHGRFEEVASLMSMMSEFQCTPDTRTYNTLISLYLKVDDIETAVSYFSEMKTAGLLPDSVSYRTLVYAYSLRGLVIEVETLIMEMQQQKLDIDEYTHSAVTRMYVNVGSLGMAWSWFEKFIGTMSSECFSANIDAFGEKGEVNLAEKAFMCCLDKQKQSLLVFNVMIKAYGIGKKYDKACELFDSMSHYEVVPDNCTCTSLIQILSTAELPHKSVSYLQKMQERGLICECIPYSMVMSTFSKLRELQMVEDLFKEMIDSKIEPDIVSYSILIDAFSEVGNIKKAISYVDFMKKDGFTLNSIICNSLIKLFTKLGYLQEAQEVYELLKSLTGSPDLYSSNCMIDLYSENSMVTEAQEVFVNLKSNGLANEFSYSVMLCLYKKLGRLRDAYEISQEMQASGLVSSTLTYNNIIVLHTSEGRLKEAAEVFQHMLASGVQLNDATFRALGTLVLKHGVSKDAIKHLETIRKEDAQAGLHEWLKALCAILRMDFTSPKHSGKIRS